MTDAALLARLDRSLERIDRQMERGNELMAAIREDFREEHRLNRAEHRLARAAIHNNNQILRELLLQRAEDRRILERVEHGIAAQTQGLLRVLDRLGGDGPRTARA